MRDPVQRPAEAAPARPRGRARRIAAVLLGIALLAAFRLPGESFPARWALGWFVPALSLAGVAWWRRRRGGGGEALRVDRRAWAPFLVLAVALAALLTSGATRHRWFFFLHWIPVDPGWPRYPYLFLVWLLLAALLVPVLAVPRRRLPAALLALFLGGMALCLLGLGDASGWRAVARDDHPSMMFRLWELAQTWPRLLNYSPYWNAGTVDFASTASGVNGLGFLLRPLFLLWPVQRVYTPALAVAFIVLVPLVAALSVRIAGGRGAAPWAGGLLALGVSQHFFLWLMQFGTVGACFSSVFILPFAASVFRVLWLGRREGWLAVALVGSLAMLLMWPPGAFMAATVVPAALATARRWTGRRIAFLALCGALGLVLHYRTFALVLLHGGSELADRDLAVAAAPAAAGALGRLRQVGAALGTGGLKLVAHLREVNPLIVVLGFAGAFVFPGRGVRRWFGAVLLGLAALCGWGPLVLPNLELGRMSIPLAFAAIAPAALAIERLLRGGYLLAAPARALVVALLALGAVNAAALYGGRQRLLTVKYLGGRTQALVDAIRAHAAPGSRVLFAGPCVHGYGDGGHVAMLPCLTGLEMMACDYYHFPPSEVEYEYPHQPFRDRPDAMYAFLRDHAVSLVVTRPEALHRLAIPWARQLAREPGRYQPVAGFAGGRYAAFRVAGGPFTKFLEGEGTCTATFNRIEVSTADPGRNAVLAYNWHDDLRVRPPVRIRPRERPGGVRFIEIEWNGATSCTIEYASEW